MFEIAHPGSCQKRPQGFEGKSRTLRRFLSAQGIGRERVHRQVDAVVRSKEVNGYRSSIPSSSPARNATFEALLKSPIHSLFVIRHLVQQNDVVIGAVTSPHHPCLRMHAVMVSYREFVLLPCLVVVAHKLDGQL